MTVEEGMAFVARARRRVDEFLADVAERQRQNAAAPAPEATDPDTEGK